MFQNNFGGFYGNPYNNVWGQNPFVYNLGSNLPFNYGGNVPFNYGCNPGSQVGWGTLPFNYGTAPNTGNFGGFPTWNYNNPLGGNLGAQTFPGTQNLTPGFTNQNFGWPMYNGLGFGPFGCTTPNCQ